MCHWWCRRRRATLARMLPRTARRWRCADFWTAPWNDSTALFTPDCFIKVACGSTAAAVPLEGAIAGPDATTTMSFVLSRYCQKGIVIFFNVLYSTFVNHFTCRSVVYE